jgi:hypothetical protein
VESGKYLKYRRGIIGLTFFSCAALGVVAAYQVGILKSLPQPGARAFSTEKVNGSGQAYSMLRVPDGFLGLVSYAMTACLASMGQPDRWRTSPLVVLGMGFKVLADAGMAGKLTLDEVTKIRAFSIWSVFTSVSTLAVLPMAYPEVKAALGQMMRGKN